MDADLRELAEILAKAPRENNLTVKWAVVIGIFVAVCSFLFVGYGSNANRLTKLETQYDFTVKAVADLKASQARVGMRTWTIIIFSILFVIMALVMLYFGGVL